jgi:hypothetical protein
MAAAALVLYVMPESVSIYAQITQTQRSQAALHSGDPERVMQEGTWRSPDQQAINYWFLHLDVRCGAPIAIV